MSPYFADSIFQIYFPKICFASSTQISPKFVFKGIIINYSACRWWRGTKQVPSLLEPMLVQFVNPPKQRNWQVSDHPTTPQHSLFYGFNSLAPGGFDYSLKINKFQTHFNDKYLKYFLWNCYQVNATTPHWSLVNIGSSNGLVPSGNNPLPKQMLT